MGGIYLVKGTDPILRDREVARLVDELLAGEDRTFVVEEHTVPAKAGGNSDDDAPSEDGAGAAPVVSAIVNAAQSPPFMTAQRIVVVRDYEALPADAVGPVVDVMGDLLDTTILIFVSGAGGRVVKALTDALKSANTRGPGSEKLADVLQQELDRAGMTLKGDAARVVIEHLGEEAGRVAALVDVWESTFGPGTHLELADVVPYLNDLGSVKPFELTNRIEDGDVAGALATLSRLVTVTSPMQPKPMHPLQVLGILAGRYRRLGRLDDDAVQTVDDAHRVWDLKAKNQSKSSYPAQKALEAARALGSDGLARVYEELHRADIAIKGATGMPAATVLEITVARLAQLHRGPGRRAPRSGSAAGSGRRRGSTPGSA